jgi:hypothetical protein
VQAVSGTPAEALLAAAQVTHHAHCPVVVIPAQGRG